MLDHDSSHWTTSLSRWLIWLATTAIMLFDTIIVFEAVNSLLRMWQDYEVARLIQSGDPNRDLNRPYFISYSWQVGTVVVLALLFITFSIMNEVWLRRGELKGGAPLMFKRAGIIVGVELAIAAVVYLIHVITGY